MNSASRLEKVQLFGDLLDKEQYRKEWNEVIVPVLAAASTTLNVDSCVVNLLDDKKQVTVAATDASAVGKTIPVEKSMCQHVIKSSKPLITAKLPSGQPVVFYAGAPLTLGKETVGTLCALHVDGTKADGLVHEFAEEGKKSLLLSFAGILEKQLQLVASLRQSKQQLASKVADLREKTAAVDYQAMKFRQLLKLADDRGLDADDCESKNELVALLQAADERAAAGGGSGAQAAAGPVASKDGGVRIENPMGLSLKGRPALMSVDRAPHLSWFDKFDQLAPPEMGIPRPPVHTNDAERVALCRKLGLLEPSLADDDLLNALCRTAQSVLGVSLAVINVMGDELGVSAGKGLPDHPFVTMLHGKSPRCFNLCNYVVFGRGNVVVDRSNPNDPDARPAGGPQFYAGVPVMVRGLALASFCLLGDQWDVKFGPEQEDQLKKFAESAAQHWELRLLRLEHATLSRSYQHLQAQQNRDEPPPAAPTTTFVFTDIQDSTVLWERHAQSGMKECQQAHDAVMRSCLAATGGYEVFTEGDAFFAAFHLARDAVDFCVRVQKAMREQKWPGDLPIAVRMGVHCGGDQCEQSEHPQTKRPTYSGVGVELARAVSDSAAGGQTVLSEAVLGHLMRVPEGQQLVHLGRYAVGSPERKIDILQIGPAGGEPQQFPALRKLKQVSKSFFEAPTGSPVFVLFLLAVGVEELHLSERATQEPDYVANLLAQLKETVASAVDASPSGYLSQVDSGTHVAVFSSAEEAACVAVAVRQANVMTVRAGIVAGEFVNRVPHPATGRTDFFGPVMNRAARVAYAAHAHQLLIGEQDSAGDAATPPMTDPACQHRGQMLLKGIEKPVNVWEIDAEGVSDPAPDHETLLTGANMVGKMLKMIADMGAANSNDQEKTPQ